MPSASVSPTLRASHASSECVPFRCPPAMSDTRRASRPLSGPSARATVEPGQSRSGSSDAAPAHTAPAASCAGGRCPSAPGAVAASVRYPALAMRRWLRPIMASRRYGAHRQPRYLDVAKTRCRPDLSEIRCSPLPTSPAPGPPSSRAGRRFSGLRRITKSSFCAAWRRLRNDGGLYAVLSSTCSAEGLPLAHRIPEQWLG